MTHILEHATAMCVCVCACVVNQLSPKQRKFSRWVVVSESVDSAQSWVSSTRRMQQPALKLLVDRDTHLRMNTHTHTRKHPHMHIHNAQSLLGCFFSTSVSLPEEGTKRLTHHHQKTLGKRKVCKHLVRSVRHLRDSCWAKAVTSFYQYLFLGISWIISEQNDNSGSYLLVANNGLLFLSPYSLFTETNTHTHMPTGIVTKQKTIILRDSSPPSVWKADTELLIPQWQPHITAVCRGQYQHPHAWIERHMTSLSLSFSLSLSVHLHPPPPVALKSLDLGPRSKLCAPVLPSICACVCVCECVYVCWGNSSQGKALPGQP